MTAIDDPAAMARLSLQEIENDDWGDPDPDDTPLVQNCMLLRRKPLGELDDEDVLELIAQRISWPVLVPMALGMLAIDPWLDCDLYLGALLAGVAGVRDEYWRAHPDQEEVFQRILEQVLATLDADPGYAPGDSDIFPPDHYPGAAVAGVMGIPASYWQTHPDQYDQMRGIVARASADGLLSEDQLAFDGALYM